MSTELIVGSLGCFVFGLLAIVFADRSSRAQLELERFIINPERERPMPTGRKGAYQLVGAASIVLGFVLLIWRPF